MAELQLLIDGVVVKKFPLDKTSVKIGRAQANDIIIEDDAVSGEHARITVVADKYIDDLLNFYIEDLDSTNGTFVNDEPVRRHQLQNLDSLRIAWTDFRFISDKNVEVTKTSYIVR